MRTTKRGELILKLAVAAMIGAGIFSGQPLRANTCSETGNVTVWGDPGIIGFDASSGDGFGGDNVVPWGPSSTSPSGGGGGAAAATTGGLAPSPCSDAAIGTLSKASATDPVKSLSQAEAQALVATGAIPADRAKAMIDGKYGAGTWDLANAAKQKAWESMPVTMWMPPGTTVNGQPIVALIFVPADANGNPLVLSDPAAYSVYSSQVGSYGSYGATWRGLVYSLGMTNLATSLSESDAHQFITDHEYAHVQSPGTTHDPLQRNESTFFDGTGRPASTDGLAFLDLAAQKGNNTPGDNYNAEVKNLANGAKIPEPKGSETSNPNC